MTLSLEQRLACLGVRAVLVPCPELGGDIWVRGLTGAEKKEWLAHTLPAIEEARQLHALPVSLRQISETTRADAKIQRRNCELVALCALDGDGNRLLSDVDLDVMADYRFEAVIDRLVAAIDGMNGERLAQQGPDAS